MPAVWAGSVAFGLLMATVDVAFEPEPGMPWTTPP